MTPLQDFKESYFFMKKLDFYLLNNCYITSIFAVQDTLLSFARNLSKQMQKYTTLTMGMVSLRVVHCTTYTTVHDNLALVPEKATFRDHKRTYDKI